MLGLPATERHEPTNAGKCSTNRAARKCSTTHAVPAHAGNSRYWTTPSEQTDFGREVDAHKPHRARSPARKTLRNCSRSPLSDSNRRPLPYHGRASAPACPRKSGLCSHFRFRAGARTRTRSILLLPQGYPLPTLGGARTARNTRQQRVGSHLRPGARRSCVRTLSGAQARYRLERSRQAWSCDRRRSRFAPNTRSGPAPLVTAPSQNPRRRTS